MEQINFITINTKDLWKKGSLENLSIEKGELGLSSTYIYKFIKDVIDEKGNLVISDIAVDECDAIYVTTCIKDKDKNKDKNYEKNVIFCYSPFKNSVKGQRDYSVKELGCKSGVPPVSLNSPSGIGIDRDTIYIADSTGKKSDPSIKPRIIALARSNFQIRWEISEFSGASLGELVDIAIGPDEHIYVLEKGGVLRINRGGTEISRIISGFTDPTDIAVDKEGNIYVLDKNVEKNVDKSVDKSVVLIFKKDGTPDKQIPVPFPARGLAVDASGQIFVGESGPSDFGKTIHKLELDGSSTPLWSYRDSAGRLILNSKNDLYVINGDGNKLTFLEYTKISNPTKEGSFSGAYISHPIDSHNSKTRWHRFILEGKFPEGTKIDFFYFVSDELDELIDAEKIQWIPEISGASAVQGDNIRDSLFQKDIRGQYLRFKILFTGTETLSPAVDSLKIFFPRSSYLDYLPAIYQEDPVGREFLERFLSIFESIFFEIDFNIDHLSRFFDACGAPPEFLSWLGSWIAIPDDENFPENLKRLYILKAISLYKKRGTREGLEDAIAFFLYTKKNPDKNPKDIPALYQDEKPFIVENFRIGNGKQNIYDSSIQNDEVKLCRCMKDLYFPPDGTFLTIKKEVIPLVEVLFGKDRFSFVVFLKDASLDEGVLNTVRRIIEEQKPAHTCYSLKVLEPWFYLDMHTYLGVNTVLTKPEFVTGKTSVIGRDTVLDDREQAGQVTRHARAGIDTVLT